VKPLTAKPTQLSRTGAGNHEPPAFDRVPFERAGVLKQKRAGPALEATGDALDSNEARRPVLAHRLQEVDDSLALDVAAEGLGDLDLDELRPLVDLFVGLCLVRLYSTRPVACVLLASFTGSPFSRRSSWLPTRGRFAHGPGRANPRRTTTARPSKDSMPSSTASCRLGAVVKAGGVTISQSVDLSHRGLPYSRIIALPSHLGIRAERYDRR
jgi:hypothetical protein